MQPRQLEGKRGRPALISSLPGGEIEMGIYRSPAFEIPAKLSFWLAGHNGEPQTPDARRNLVRLVDASTGEVLRDAYPPRNDVAQRIEWDLKDVAGRSARSRSSTVIQEPPTPGSRPGSFPSPTSILRPRTPALRPSP